MQVNDILLLMKGLLFVLLVFLSFSAVAAEESLGILDAEFWFTPRHGDVVLSNKMVQAAVKRLIAEPDAYLALRYPAGETGELWSQELQGWLVSLGLVSDRIELQSGHNMIEGVELVVITPDVEGEPPLEQIDATPVTGEEVPPQPGADAVEMKETAAPSGGPMAEERQATSQERAPAAEEVPLTEELQPAEAGPAQAPSENTETTVTPQTTEQQDPMEQE
jgi:hypothetical protein